MESPYMRVARFVLQPGESLPRHPGLNRVVYALTPFTVRYASDNWSVDQTIEAGSVQYYEADTHSVTNIGDTEARYLMFEMRE